MSYAINSQFVLHSALENALFYLKYQNHLPVVSRYRDQQLRVGENYSYVSNIYNSYPLNICLSHKNLVFILQISKWYKFDCLNIG